MTDNADLFRRTSVQQTGGRLVFNLGNSREVLCSAVVIESIQRASAPDAIDYAWIESKHLQLALQLADGGFEAVLVVPRHRGGAP